MSDVAEVYEYLKGVGIYHIATVDAEGKPHVRPFGSKLFIDDKLYFSCSLPKKVYDQLVGQKYFEISAYGSGKGMEWLRISGTARELTGEEKQAIFDSPDSPYGKGGRMQRSIDEVGIFEASDVTAWVYKGEETLEYHW